MSWRCRFQPAISRRPATEAVTFRNHDVRAPAFSCRGREQAGVEQVAAMCAMLECNFGQNPGLHPGGGTGASGKRQRRTIPLFGVLETG
jgi:hypothetical protein